MADMDAIEVLALPMQRNDAGAATIGDYLKKLLLLVWSETEGFNGKRPFGNSSWEYEVYIALANGGAIEARFDSEGCLEEFDDEVADRVIREAIERAFSPGEMRA